MIRNDIIKDIKFIRSDNIKKIFKTADGSDFKALGEIQTSVEIDGKILPCKLNVCEKLNEDVIIGADILSVNKIIVDMHKGLILNTLTNGNDDIRKNLVKFL